MSTTGNPFGAAQAMAAFNQRNASNPFGMSNTRQGLTKEQANQQSAQAFSAAVQAANPHLDFSKRNLNNLTGMVDPYQQAEEYYRRYGTGMPQTPGGSVGFDPVTGHIRFDSPVGAPIAPQQIGDGGRSTEKPSVFPGTESKGVNTAASQLAAMSRPQTTTGSPFGETNTRESLYQQPMQQSQTAAFPGLLLQSSQQSPYSNISGSPQLQSAINSRYGGNQNVIPLEGRFGLVRLAKGGDVSKSRQLLDRFAYGGLVSPQAEWFLSSEDADTQKRMQDQAKTYEDEAAAYNAAQQKYKTEVYDPYVSQIEAYNKAVEAFNAGPRTSPFGMSVPTEPEPFSMTAPTLPFTEEQAKQTTADIQKRADEQYLGRAAGLEVMLDPKKYNLGIRSIFDSPTRRFNQGGEATTDDFIKSNVPRGTSEVPEVDSKGNLIDENAEMRSEAQRMLNRLKTIQQESYRRGKLPPGVQRAVTDVASEEKPPLIRGPVIQAGRDIVGGAVGATPTDPTNPSNLQRLVQGFTGAYLPTAPVGRATQAVKTAVQEPRATMSAAGQSAQESLKALGDIPVALAQPNQLGAQAGMVRLGVKESGSKPSSIFTPLPKADAPFVGRLDTFVSELPGPVRKDQFLGSLEGKFRNYEIGRAQEALRDLPGDAKLSPVDLLNRIKQRYDPAYYRTQVVEPRPSSFYYQMDNVYQGPAGDEFPLGVIHLIQADNPQNVSKGFGKKLEKMIDRTFGGSLSPEELTETRSDLLNIFGTLSSADKRRLARSWTPYVRANQEAEGFEQTGHYLLYPTLNRDFTETIFKNSLSSPSTRDAALTQILQDTAEIAKNKYGIEGLEPHLPGLIQEHLGNRSGTEAYNAVRGLISNRRRELSTKVHNSAKEFRSTLRDLEDKQVEKYRGQHTTLENENNPIAFSRFSEHTTDIPGLGTTKGIYVNELQSDRLDDIRTKGPYGGSAQKDLATRVIPLKEQQAQLLEQFIKLKSKGASYDQLSAASKQFKALDEKIAKATKRVMEGTYSLRESFPGMEESPQVIQQLMAKNVISAAINRGVNFVAFPGAESKQAQLYEKLPNNLKQVVKDLGPGFEFRPVTLKTPDGQEITHPAVVWGPEAADRIKQEGVPFKDGGEVNVPRGTSTSKQQLDKLAQISQRKKA